MLNKKFVFCVNYRFRAVENSRSSLYKILIPNGNHYLPKGAQNYYYFFDIQTNSIPKVLYIKNFMQIILICGNKTDLQHINKITFYYI
ncbi:hypothetical protein GCM10007424_05940 [Flavobacterium suaedae]|uniref:Uncharacterized protein n=1 Tax=Flavobacterium suaedae TaxID=1767027 RepID=A0ABQ1JKN9_9FLAO|nr:hypothetical protein GCM10007424_05940 [Flavobacterium suaedae]